MHTYTHILTKKSCPLRHTHTHTHTHAHTCTHTPHTHKPDQFHDMQWVRCLNWKEANQPVQSQQCEWRGEDRKTYMLPTHQTSDRRGWKTTLMAIVMKQMMRKIVMAATIHTCSSRIRGSGSWCICLCDCGCGAGGCSGGGRHRSDTNEVKLTWVTFFVCFLPCSLIDRYPNCWP